MNASANATLPSIHSLGDEANKAFFRNTFSQESRFEHEFGADAAELDCPQAFTLREEVIRLLHAKDIPVPQARLEELHRHISPELMAYNLDDGVNKISKYLYDTDALFQKEYHHFIKTLDVYFPYPFYFQATPTIRIQCPDAENSHHYPRYHTDVGYGHPPKEINIWIPLTAPVPPQCHGFRRMDVKNSYEVLAQFDFSFAAFIERAVNDKPFNHTLDRISPQVATPMGKLSVFDSRCIHTGEALQRHTRVSIDIRIIPVEDFNQLSVEYQGTGRRKVRFIPGQGYYSLSSKEL